MSFFDDLKEKGHDLIDDIKEKKDEIKEHIKEEIEEFAEKSLNFVGQDVLDKMIDKIVKESNEEIQENGLDPLTIDDITIPFGLDQIANVFGTNPMFGFLAACCACLSKTIHLEGELLLKNGLLSGLSNLSRTMPTTLEVKDGFVRITAGISVSSLEAPFETSSTLSMSEKFSPEIKAKVEKIGLKFGIAIPIMHGEEKDGFLDFDPPLEDLPVDVDVKLDELGELEQYFKPYIIDPVKSKVGEILRKQVKELVEKIMNKEIPGLSALKS